MYIEHCKAYKIHPMLIVPQKIDPIENNAHFIHESKGSI
jgi:hypothetical protein